VNAYPYRGISPRQTSAQRARRSLILAIGRDAVDAIDRERVDYYRSLIRQVRLSDPSAKVNS
jgi:hypothetical protein